MMRRTNKKLIASMNKTTRGRSKRGSRGDRTEGTTRDKLVQAHHRTTSVDR